MQRFIIATVECIIVLAFPGVAAEVLSPSVSPPRARAASPPAVGVRGGALVLVGGGDLPEAIRSRFLELAGGKTARIFLIPSASARPDAAARSFDFWKTAPVASVRVLDAANRRQANDPAFYGQLRSATGVWIAGGDQSRLTALYGGTGVERELGQLLQRGGVVGGTSAGASVVSAVMMDDGRAAKGFGLVARAIVDQHFSNRNRLARLLDLVRHYPDQVGIGIDEETAVVIRGGEVTVMGNGTVSVCKLESSRPSVRVCLPGSRLKMAW